MSSSPRIWDIFRLLTFAPSSIFHKVHVREPPRRSNEADKVYFNTCLFVHVFFLSRPFPFPFHFSFFPHFSVLVFVLFVLRPLSSSSSSSTSSSTSFFFFCFFSLLLRLPFLTLLYFHCFLLPLFFSSIHLHFFQNLSRLFPVLAVANTWFLCRPAE